MLRAFRKMGCMEQMFSIFKNYCVEGWGPAVMNTKIIGLSQISLDKIQSICNKIHLKYESMQCQILSIDDVNEYDDLYIGCLPYKVIKCDEMDINELFTREMNHRFLFLNDFNLTKEIIECGKYKVENIEPLYRIFICNDFLILNMNHAICDVSSLSSIITDIACLLNEDTFDEEERIPYMSIEQCIEPKYASTSIQRKIESIIPTNWAIKFGKWYANNTCLTKYNPLAVHRDDILRFQCYTPGKFLSFAFQPIDKKDYHVNFKSFCLSKSISMCIQKQCKLHKVHMSSLLQYLIIASLIEAQNHVLTKEYYKTISYNTFTAIPMYKKPIQKQYSGCHANSYAAIIEYYQNIVIGSDKFWDIISKIDEQVLNDDMIKKVYQGKFPTMNLKKFMKDVIENKTEPLEFGGGCVSNPGVLNMNKSHWKHKIIQVHPATNPAVGMGGVYLLVGTTIKGIDEMTMTFVYGKQYLSQNIAQKVMDKLRQKLEMVGSSAANLQSKL